MSKRIFLLILLFLPLMVLAKPRQKIWVIDAGHGGNDHGCESAKAMEKDITLKLAKRVRELVLANIPNVKVVLTREYDRYLSLDQRCTIANTSGADLFLSIHVNALPEIKTINGTETFYGPLGATKLKELERLRKKNIQKSELLAWMMQKQYGLVGRPTRRGVKQERYQVCLYTRMPAILTEVGFISNPSDERYMLSRDGGEEIAQCIYKGLKEYNEVVQKDKIQSTLAMMRRNGAKSLQVIPQSNGPVKLTNDNLLAQNTTTPATTTPTAPVTTVAPTTTSTSTVAVKPTETVTKPVAKPETKPVTKPVEDKSLTKTEVISVNKDVLVQDNDTLLDNTIEPEVIDDPLMFSVQIFSLKAKLQPTDPRFKGLKDLLVVERDGLYKYLCGTTGNYTAARQLLAEVRKSFPDAFLVVYKGNVQISMSDALEMLPQ